MRKYMIFLCFLFFGCAGPVAKGPQFSTHSTVNEGESLVYVYQKRASYGASVCLKLLFNEVESGCLKGEGFIKTRLVPGSYELVLQSNAFMGPRIIEYEFSVEPESVYYYEFATTTGGLPNDTVASRFFSFWGVSGNNVLIQKDEEMAIPELELLRESL